jgi:hypothetical protein
MAERARANHPASSRPQPLERRKHPRS